MIVTTKTEETTTTEAVTETTLDDIEVTTTIEEDANEITTTEIATTLEPLGDYLYLEDLLSPFLYQGEGGNNKQPS